MSSVHSASREPRPLRQSADGAAGEAYREHPWFDQCAMFCERWDQASFDPDYPTEPLEHFEPLVREVFGRPAFQQGAAAAE